MEVLSAEIPPRLEDRARTDLGVVAADRVVEGVRKDAAAVEALPPEQVERHLVGFRPVHLDREEVLDAGEPQQLRQGRREAEAVGQPADGMAAAEQPFEIALAVEQLPHKQLRRRHVGVGLDPHRADRLPLPGGNLLLDLRDELRIVLLEKGVELGGRGVEAEVRMAIHQPDHRVERAVGFPPRLRQRPQPGKVDMGMTGQCQRAVLRIAPAQPFERGNQGVARRRNGFPLGSRRGLRAIGERSFGSSQIACCSRVEATRAM